MLHKMRKEWSDIIIDIGDTQQNTDSCKKKLSEAVNEMSEREKKTEIVVINLQKSQN